LIYEHSIDNAIIKELEKSEKLGFHKLLVAVKKVNPKTTTHRTLSKHLNVMSQQHMIIRDGFIPGKARYCCLHPDVRLQKELGIFEGVKSNRERVRKNEETEEKKMRKAIPLLLSLAAFGAQYPRVAKGPEHLVPGRLVVYNPLKGKKEEVFFEEVPGISVSDIIERKSITNLGKFEHLQLTGSEAERSIKVLTKHNLLIPIDESNGETRFGISRGNKLKEFVEDCNYALDNAILRMEVAWRCRRPSVKKEEVKWYKWFYGQARTTRFFDEVRNKRFCMNKDPNKNKIKQSKRKIIKKYDDEMEYRLKKLDGSHYNTIREEYSVFYNVMKEMIYPHFLEELVKRHKV
jgi:DNA-binding HxlR family transcriptional regulator